MINLINTINRLTLIGCICIAVLMLIGFIAYDVMLYNSFKRLLNGEVVWKPAPLTNLAAAFSRATDKSTNYKELDSSELSPDNLNKVLKPYQQNLLDLILNKQHIVKIDYDKDKAFEHVFKNNQELQKLTKELINYNIWLSILFLVNSILSGCVVIHFSDVPSLYLSLIAIITCICGVPIIRKHKLEAFNLDASNLINKQMGTNVQSIDNFVEQDTTDDNEVTDGLYTLAMIMQNEFHSYDLFTSPLKYNFDVDSMITSHLSGLITRIMNKSEAPYYSNYDDRALLETLPEILLTNRKSAFDQTYNYADSKISIVRNVWNFNQAAYTYLNNILYADVCDNRFYKRNYKTAEQMINVLQLALAKNSLDEKLITLSDELNNDRLVKLIKTESSSDMNPATAKIVKFMAETGYELSQVLLMQIKIFLDYSAQDSVAIKEDNRISTNLDNMDTDTLLEHYEQMQKHSN